MLYFYLHFFCIFFYLPAHFTLRFPCFSFVLSLKRLFFLPLRGCQQTESCCTSHSAGRVDASPFPVMSPFQLWKHTHTHTLSHVATALQLHVFLLVFPGRVKVPTKIHLFVASGTQVGLSGERGDTASCWHTSHIQIKKLKGTFICFREAKLPSFVTVDTCSADFF